MAGPTGAERAIGRLASLVTQVVESLDTPADAVLYDAVARCNTALEAYLEEQRERETRERVDPAAAARDELLRLAQRLTAVDGADVDLVLRRIRRVLGRLDSAHDAAV